MWAQRELADSTLKAIKPPIPASPWLSEELEPKPLCGKALTRNLTIPCPLPRPARQRQPVCRGPRLPLGGRIKQRLRPGSSAVTSSSCLSPPARLLSPNPPPPHGPGRLTGLHCPRAPAPPLPGGWAGHRQPGSGFCRLLTEAPGGGAALPASSAETCRFIPRTHHAAFTQCPDLGNWAGRCLVMLAGPRVNARIQLISFRQSKRPLPCFLPNRSLAPKPPQPPCVCVPRRHQVCRDFQIQ